MPYHYGGPKRNPTLEFGGLGSTFLALALNPEYDALGFLNKVVEKQTPQLSTSYLEPLSKKTLRPVQNPSQQALYRNPDRNLIHNSYGPVARSDLRSFAAQRREDVRGTEALPVNHGFRVSGSRLAMTL